MKKAYLILLSVFVCECNLKPDNEKKSVKASIKKIQAASTNKSTSGYDTLISNDKDSVVIYADEGHNVKTTKKDLKNILKKYPEIEEQLPPDVMYSRKAYNNLDFSSEVGQDDYYIIYAYYLKQHNGDRKYAQRRNKLIALYRHVNLMMNLLNNGGTYYGHMYRRILGVAEYSVFLYKEGYYEKDYNIKKQKTLYINWLKQFLTDELNNNLEISDKDKTRLKKDLLNIVNDISNLLTEYFYLERAQEFQFSHY